MRDLIIIGGGPAGLTAGLYAARARLDVVLLEKLMPGGQVLTTDWVENFPGFPDGISGFELMDRMKNQAERFGLPIESQEVSQIEIAPEKKAVLSDNGRLDCRAMILACGAAPRKLEIEGESLLTGKGVSYCATCDGPFYRDQSVAVIGGGDTAVEEAIFLTRFADKVYLIHRRDELRAIKLLQDRARAEDKIEFLWSTIPVQIMGNDQVEGLLIKDLKTGEQSEIPVQGVFVFIGYKPNSELLGKQVELDQDGFVVTDNEMATSAKGIFAAGDIRSKQLRQVSTAVGDGAVASFSAQRYLGYQ